MDEAHLRMAAAVHQGLFSGKEGRALERAHEIRKFEIELYWKRASYFWTFIGVAFAGYFSIAAIDGGKVPQKDEYRLIVACVGIVFSAAWYLANRGSKFWQENWEHHIDLLEDSVTGPLQKSVVVASRPAWKMLSRYRFSVSRINALVSLYVLALWVFMTAQAISTMWGWREPFFGFNFAILIALTVMAVGWMLSCWESSQDLGGAAESRAGVGEVITPGP